MADDDEGDASLQYENGHWDWDDVAGGLIFISDIPPVTVESIHFTAKAPMGTVEFRDDVDVFEQIRFRRRYQRKLKPGQADVITVQDAKDIALFTAPASIMSPVLINMLHLSTTERFIRALIIYCQYYLQIENEMSRRMLELETKVRTPDSELVEIEYRDNLADLRLLVSKEYSTMLIGGSDLRKYHHMGPLKKRRSLSDKDARLFETLLRMCVQITWLALGRKAFNQIELEMNRLFKTEIFNATEHTLNTNYISKMRKEERAVLLGQCVRHDKKLNTRSPLMNEVFCHRPIDYTMMGLGVIKYDHLTARLRYMLLAVAGPEEVLLKLGISVGILGMPRSSFDTMLRQLPMHDADKKSRLGPSVTGSIKSSNTMKKSTQGFLKLYRDIVLPEKEFEVDFPDSFPDMSEEIRICSNTQRRCWLNKFKKLFQHQATSQVAQETLS